MKEVLSKEYASKDKSLKDVLWRFVLAAQHLIAMFGSTVLVPFLTGLDTSVALFAAGVGTLIFHLCTKGKVPVFLGSSFAFIPVIIAVGDKYGDLRYAQGGILVAGLIYIIVSFLIKRIGVGRIRAILPAQVVGPMIMVIGLNLIPTAYGMAKDNYILALITLGSTLLIKFFGKGFINQIAILCGVFIGYISALFMNAVDMSGVASASILSVPNFTFPRFDIGAIVVIAPVVLAVFMEHIGDITTNGQVVGENFIEDPGLNKTLLGDGLATVASALVGGPANTTYGENTGVLATTKNYDPSILRITAIFAIIISFVGKCGALIQSIPQSVMGGISLILFSMIAIIGVKTIKNERVKFNWKNTLIMIIILGIGFVGPVIESKYGILIGIKITNDVSISGLSFAAIVGVLLNLLLNGISTKEN